MHIFGKPAFGLSLVAGLLAATAMALPTNEAEISKNETKIFGLMQGMEKHPDGIIHLGDDGVLRSFHSNLTVLGYKKLNAHQIQKFIDGHGRNDHLTEVYHGVNGHDVTGEQLLHPGHHLMPRDFPHDYPEHKTHENANGKRPTSANPKAMQPRGVPGTAGLPGNTLQTDLEIGLLRDRCHQIYCSSNQECWDNHPTCHSCVRPDGERRGICWP